MSWAVCTACLAQNSGRIVPSSKAFLICLLLLKWCPTLFLVGWRGANFLLPRLRIEPGTAWLEARMSHRFCHYAVLPKCPSFFVGSVSFRLAGARAGGFDFNLGPIQSRSNGQTRQQWNVLTPDQWLLNTSFEKHSQLGMSSLLSLFKLMLIINLAWLTVLDQFRLLYFIWRNWNEQFIRCWLRKIIFVLRSTAKHIHFSRKIGSVDSQVKRGTCLWMHLCEKIKIENSTTPRTMWA